MCSSPPPPPPLPSFPLPLSPRFLPLPFPFPPPLPRGDCGAHSGLVGMSGHRFAEPRRLSPLIPFVVLPGGKLVSPFLANCGGSGILWNSMFPYSSKGESQRLASDLPLIRAPFCRATTDQYKLPPNKLPPTTPHQAESSSAPGGEWWRLGHRTCRPPATVGDGQRRMFEVSFRNVRNETSFRC